MLRYNIPDNSFMMPEAHHPQKKVEWSAFNSDESYFFDFSKAGTLGFSSAPSEACVSVFSGSLPGGNFSSALSSVIV